MKGIKYLHSWEYQKQVVLPNPTRLIVSLLCFNKILPTAVEPVKLIFFTIGFSQNSLPTSGVVSVSVVLLGMHLFYKVKKKNGKEFERVKIKTLKTKKMVVFKEMINSHQFKYALW